MTSKPLIVPSVLPADQARLGEECEALAAAGVDRIQWDVMDGRFVPNLTFGPDVIAACRARVETPFEAHLMVVEPDALLPRYAEAGCELIIVHAEACTHLHRTLGRVRDLGVRAGVALNPHSPIDLVAHVLAETDLLLIMTVNPGFGGQHYIEAMEPKIRQARELIDRTGRPIELEVDGGITDTTFISGSWLFNHPAGKAAGAALLRSRASAAGTG
jgi:ribulose-phosphate 3-epimerase